MQILWWWFESRWEDMFLLLARIFLMQLRRFVFICMIRGSLIFQLSNGFSNMFCGTLEHGLQLYWSSTTSLVAYLDVDWAGCPTTTRSTSVYSVFFGNNLFYWSSKLQHTLSRSSAKAEYRCVPMLLLRLFGCGMYYMSCVRLSHPLVLFTVIMSVLFICLLIRSNINLRSI